MSQKYVIGLTGNIAAGKSIVRRMLQELGASTVDADSVVHVLQRPGTAVYKEIVQVFGSFILNKDATINRKRLSDVAFSVPDALVELERIIHPAVRRHLLRAIEKATQLCGGHRSDKVAGKRPGRPLRRRVGGDRTGRHSDGAADDSAPDEQSGGA